MVVLTGESGPARRITSDSFDEARRTAQQIALRSRPCAVIVCNAYHHVIDSRLITDVDQPAAH